MECIFLHRSFLVLVFNIWNSNSYIMWFIYDLLQSKFRQLPISLIYFTLNVPKNKCLCMFAQKIQVADFMLLENIFQIN